LSKREPKVEGLHNNPIHQKIVGGIRIDYSYKVLAAHRFYNNIALLPRTGKFDGSSEGLDTILGIIF
jgi:hypothetical protein